MKSLLLTIFAAFTLNAALIAQNPCNEPTIVMQGNHYNNPIILTSSNNPIPTITYTNTSTNLPNVEFLIINKSYYGQDGLTNPIVAIANTPDFVPADMGIRDCEDFQVLPIIYNLNDIQNLVQAILTQNYAPSISCCAATQMFSLDICTEFTNAGINSGSDVTSINAVFSMVSLLTGGTDLTVDGAIMALDMLNSFLPSFGDCAGNLPNGICYAIDSTSYNYYAIVGSQLTAFETSDSAHVQFPMGSTLAYQVSQFTSFSTIDNTDPCANDFIYTSLDSTLLQIVDASGQFIVLGTGIAPVQVCSRFHVVPMCDTIYFNIGQGISVVETALNTINIKVYPNPVMQDLQVQFNQELENYTMRLVDITGRIIWTEIYEAAMPNHQITIPMAHLPQGVYMLHLQNNTAQWQQKLIKY